MEPSKVQKTGDANDTMKMALDAASRHLESLSRIRKSVQLHILTGKDYYDPMRCARLKLLNRLTPIFFELIDKGDFRGLQHLVDALPMLVHTRNDRGPALLTAVAGGKVELVKVLLEAGADVNAKTDTGKRTAVILAASYENVAMMQALVDAGADVNAKDRTGKTALLTALESGHFELLEVLLKAGADANSRTPTRYPMLVSVAEKGHLKVVQQLIEAGADVNVRTPLYGYTPLMRAAWNGHLEVVNELLEAGADVSMKSTDTEFEATAFTLACRFNHVEVARALVKSVANDKSMHGASLIYAASYGRLEILKELLKAGVDPDSSSDTKSSIYRQGDTALILAAYWGHTESVQLLLKYGANVNGKNSNAETALMRAVDHDGPSLKVVRILLEAGADVNASDDYGWTALHHAFHLDVVKALLNAGADVNAKDEYGHTALMCAADIGILDLLQYFIKVGADLNAHSHTSPTGENFCCFDGQTALMLAATQGHVDVVQALFKARLELNAKSKKRGIQRIIALHDSHLDVAIGKAFLEAAADGNESCKNGETAHVYAICDGYFDIVEDCIKARSGAKHNKRAATVMRAIAEGRLRLAKAKADGQLPSWPESESESGFLVQMIMKRTASSDK